MSYRIDFYINCPMYFPEESPRFHAEILLAQGPGQKPEFSLPIGCACFKNCSVCINCYKEIRRRFQSGEISFFNDPRSVHGVYCATISKPIRPI